MEGTPNYTDVFDKCLQECYVYLIQATERKIGLDDINDVLCGEKEEFAINSRYMHRGFYCPSLDLEYIITNMRRGKIVKRKTKNMKPTNRYLFDGEGKLCIAETFFPNGSTKREYILHLGDIVLGMSFDSHAIITEISIEHYQDERIISYLWASCSNSGSNNVSSVKWMIHEKYSYENAGYLETEFYDMLVEPKKIVRYCKYQSAITIDGAIDPLSFKLIKGGFLSPIILT